MEGFATHGGVSGVLRPGRGIDTILERGRPEHTELGREIVCEAFDDDRIGAEREMGPVLFRCPDRNDESGISFQDRTHSGRCQVFEP